MHIAYIDESGDPGSRTRGGSVTYTLGVVTVPAAGWAAIFDEAVKFRRSLRDRFGLPMRAEVKANWLVRGAGAFRELRLNEPQRKAIYDLHMRFLEWNNLTTWAVVIKKPATRDPNGDVSHMAWEGMFQRLERFSTKGGAGPILICHDEGDEKRVRAHSRQRRRFGTAGSAMGGSLRHDFTDLVDDPVPRRSQDSYFIQLADLAAYAAFRSVVPPTRARQTHVVDATTWSLIGRARNRKAAAYKPRHPDTSIVLRLA